MSAPPLVTIYIPTHNRASLLARAIDSVLSQTFSSIEIIVVDDGSSDQTQPLIEAYKPCRNVRSIRNITALGACNARNLAIMEAQGLYITGLDDDDYFEPNRIASFVEAIDPNSSFLCSNYRIKVQDQVPRKLLRFPRKISRDDLLRQNHVGNQLFTRTEYLRALGGFDEEMPAWQDWELWVRLAGKFGEGRRIANASYVLDKSHPHERISANRQKLDNALQLFIEKHAGHLSAADIRGLELSLKQYEESFNARDLLPYLATSSALRAIKIYLSNKRR